MRILLNLYMELENSWFSENENLVTVKTIHKKNSL